jgi:hypothetical protein
MSLICWPQVDDEPLCRTILLMQTALKVWIGFRICYSCDIKIWEGINLFMSLCSSARYMGIPASKVLLVCAINCMITVIFRAMTVAEVWSRLARGAAVRALIQLLYTPPAFTYGTHRLAVKIIWTRISSGRDVE